MQFPDNASASAQDDPQTAHYDELVKLLSPQSSPPANQTRLAPAPTPEPAPDLLAQSSGGVDASYTAATTAAAARAADADAARSATRSEGAANERAILANLCQFTLRLVARFTSDLPDTTAIQQRCKSDVKLVWMEWESNHMLKSSLLEALTLIVQRSCPRASNVNLISDFRNWYHLQLTLQRERDHVSRPKPEPSSAPAPELNAAHQRVIMGHYCRYALKSQERLAGELPNAVEIQQRLTDEIRRLWGEWITDQIDISSLMETIARSVRGSCPAAANVNIIAEFRAWYNQHVAERAAAVRTGESFRTFSVNS